MIMITQHRDDRNARRAREYLGTRLGEPCAFLPVAFTPGVRYEISGERDQVRLKRLRDTQRALQFRLRHVGTEVDVGDLRDSKAIKGLRQTVQKEVNAFRYRILRLSHEAFEGESCADGRRQRQARSQYKLAACDFRRHNSSLAFGQRKSRIRSIDYNRTCPVSTRRMPTDWLVQLNREVVACRKCPRLVAYRETVAREKRRAYRDCEYWGKPVPGFGDRDARVLIMGLAPGAHGSNRTGRPFTGDASGNFMYPVLYETGFANQPTATDRNDGLELRDVYITAAARCAPPDNKPLPEELANCAPYLDREIQGLKKLKVVVALGKIGFDAYLNYLKRQGLLRVKSLYVFGHGAKYDLPDGTTLLASYHPSNQNTQTGKLTRKMFVEIFKQAARLADE